jgi:hypothetical protein
MLTKWAWLIGGSFFLVLVLLILIFITITFPGLKEACQELGYVDKAYIANNIVCLDEEDRAHFVIDTRKWYEKENPFSNYKLKEIKVGEVWGKLE